MRTRRIVTTGDGRRSEPRWKRDAETPVVRMAPGRELPIDKVLLSVVLGLTLFGPVMVYSASAILAQENYGTQFYFLARQGAWAALGLVLMVAAVKTDYRNYKRPAVATTLLCITIVLLVAVFLFPARNSTHRWITYGRYFSIQPSEIAKVALVIFLSAFLDRRGSVPNNFRQVFVPAAAVAGLMMGLVALQPDLGTAISIGVVFTVVMFQAGTPLRFISTLVLPAAPILCYMLFFVPWRLQRLVDFLDPWKNQTTSGFQAVQSMIAIGSGGVSGVGFAEGKQKLFFLPTPHTDFIFAVIGEELGLIGAGAVVVLFATLAWRGLRAARCAPDLFGQLLGVGLTVMIAAQALFNISVTLSLVPTKGIPLPFISSGGSSLAINLFAAGILMNISKHAKT